MTQANFLNVTLLEPRQKHPTIFQYFDKLHEGESLVIHNDHDPKPLYYQLLGERGNIFNWEYLEQGPSVWEIQISKLISSAGDQTLGEIAAKDLRKAEIFRKYGLDFCCGGKKTVKQACAEKGIDVAVIEQELQYARNAPAARSLPYNEWNPVFLADYIVNMHHAYIRKTLPDLKEYAFRVASVHGQAHQELWRIAGLIEEMNDELNSHMIKEESILFPYIRQLVQALNKNEKLHDAQFKTVQNPIDMMETEHESVAKNLEEIRMLSDNYTLPEDACASYRLLFTTLKDFESDLFVHVHLENNILFPKALKVEKELKNEKIGN